jgi:hypothetical protein
MFPVSAAKLSFLEIADYWRRESRASRNELLAKLEAAWWLGEITGNSAISRLQLLKKMYQSRHDPDRESVVFVTPNDAGPPTETPLAGGGFAVDLTPRISVSAETDDWTESSCTAAFEKLATLPSSEHFPLLSMGLHYIELTPEEFFGWVTKHDFHVPTFWKRIAEINVTQAATPQGSGISNDLHITSAVKFSGRGTKTRAIQAAYQTLFPNGEIPAGMTSQRRNELILEWLREGKDNESLPDKRTIERAIKKFIKD